MKFLIVVTVALMAGAAVAQLPNLTQGAACASPAADYKIVNDALRQLNDKLSPGKICNGTAPASDATAQVLTPLGTLIKIIDCLILALPALGGVVELVVSVVNAVLDLLCTLLRSGNTDAITKLVAALNQVVTCVTENPTDAQTCLGKLQATIQGLAGAVPKP